MERISYSKRYDDDIGKYTYRVVTIPKELWNIMPKRLLTEYETDRVGIVQSKGWENVARYDKSRELIFRRPQTPE